MDGFKALWRHTGYINEAASEIGSNSSNQPSQFATSSVLLYINTLENHSFSSFLLSLIYPWSECNPGMSINSTLGLGVGGGGAV